MSGPDAESPFHDAFDRFADGVAEFTASPFFFAACILLVVVWAPSILLIRDVDTWQLIINTTTTIVTFLMVALVGNDSHRFERSTNARLCAILEALGVPDPVSDQGQKVEEEEA